MKLCYRCGTPWESITKKIPSPKEVCTRCNAYLHCCKNCRWYLPGKMNDCHIPNADKIIDKEAGNHCDWFEFKETTHIDPSWMEKQKKAKENFERLFSNLDGEKTT